MTMYLKWKAALAACGLLALWSLDSRSFGGGRRLFVLPEEVPLDLGQDWQPEPAPAELPGVAPEELALPTDLQVQELLPPQDLMKLFKTVAASPQAVLQRMALDGQPNLQQWATALQEWKWGLTRSQITSIFQGIDLNGDGKVSLAELLSCFRHGYHGSLAAKVPAIPAAHVHGSYDCNDGLEVWRVSWSQEKLQYCSLISASELRRHLRPGFTAREVIRSLDADGDGVVSLDEWIAASRGRGPFLEAITEPEADFAFKSMDIGQDGVLTATDLGVLDLTSPELPPKQPGAHGPGAMADAKTLNQRLLAKWATLSNAFQKMDRDGNHQLSRAEFAAGLAELQPPLDNAADYLFQGLDALHDGRITPPELHGAMHLGHLFQSPEALRKAVHWSKANMEHHKVRSSWIHDAKPHWQHSDVKSGDDEKPSKFALAKSLKSFYASPASAFRGMDEDRDGEMSLEEFKEGEKKFQPSVTKSGAEEAYMMLDGDQNRKVSPDEFGAIWNAVGAGGSLDKNMKQLKSKAEDEFRQQAAKWAGSMNQACTRLGPQIGLAHFKEAIRSFEPLLSDDSANEIFHEMDSNHDGFIVPSECRLQMEQFRSTLLKSSSMRNAFVDADADHDHRLTREEFGNFGYSLDKSNSKGKYSIFFDDELDQDHDGYVALPTLETFLGTKHKDHLLSGGDLSNYELPAVVHGKCILTADKNLSPGLREEVGSAFSKALGPELNLQIRIVGVQEISHPGRGKEFDLLYTSQTTSGAGVVLKLHDQASQLQEAVEKAVAEVTKAKIQAWCSTTLDFFGPKAGKLPKGSKIKEVFGKLPA